MNAEHVLNEPEFVTAWSTHCLSISSSPSSALSATTSNPPGAGRPPPPAAPWPPSGVGRRRFWMTSQTLWPSGVCAAPRADSQVFPQPDTPKRRRQRVAGTYGNGQL